MARSKIIPEDVPLVPLPTDAQLLDALEKRIKIESLCLWEGSGEFPGSASKLPGLSLLRGRRSLRRAIADCCMEVR